MRKFLHKIFIAYCFLSINIQNLAHGFNPNTCVRNDESYFWQIEQICRFVGENEKQFVLSYDFNSKLHVNSKVLSAGESTTNCYFRFGFDENKYDNIICTPSQEFYKASSKRWIPCYQLKVGDDLLCINNKVKKIAHIKFFKDSLKVYSISIKDTNNFFVGKYSVLTHNMALPLISFGLSASFGSGAAAGGATGGYFGPVTFAIGGAVGGLIGAAYYLFSDKKIPQYDLKFDIEKVDNYHSINLRPDPTWSEDAKIVVSENKKINSSIQLSNFQFLEVQPLHDNKREHIFEKEKGIKHGFRGGPNDEDPDKWWQKIVKRVKKAYKTGEIKGTENELFVIREQQSVNPNFGDLIIRGVVESGIIKIGTAFLEK